MSYILAYGFSVGLLLSLGVTLNLTYNPSLPFLIVAVCLVFYRFSLKNRRSRIITIALLILVTMASSLILKYLGVWENIIQEVLTYGEAMNRYIFWGSHALATDYHGVTLLLIGLMISLTVYIMGIGLNKFHYIAGIGLIYFVLCPLYDRPFNSLGLLIWGISGVYNYLYLELKTQTEETAKTYIKILTYATVVLVSISSFGLALSFAHKNQHPLEWVDDLITSVEEWLKQDEQILVVSQSPDLTKTPDLNQDIMMRVEADDLLYLRGMVYETFDGKGWTAGQLAIEADNIEENLNNWYLDEPRKAHITYENLATAKLYSPLNTENIKREVGETVDYYTTFYPIPYDKPEFTIALRGSTQEVKLQSRGQMGELVEEITKPYVNAYDKVRAIEKFLADNYTYTLEPQMPEEEHVDMVNYFLFNSKEGFCSHYASAMVLMVRKLGLKARYVTGFKLPYTIPEEYLLDGQMNYMEEMKLPASYFGMQSYTVRDDDAHAWPEVYFEGLGWIPFEPTQVYHKDFYGSLVEDLAMPVLQSDQVDTPVESKDNWYIYVLYCLGVFFLLSLPLILREVAKVRYKKLPLCSKVKWQYNHFMRTLALLSPRKRKQDTILEYMTAAQIIHGKVDLIGVGAAFEKHIYSHERVKDAELEYMEEQYRMLCLGMKKRVRTVIYLWYIYVGKII